ncbi:hypothetical protein EGW08_005454 [Elysia chlorotica]|uniref:Uncharacterized protein n=1 Tax=Elysia chlorotica TaxID=188477 RepID=A0A433TYY7_ELYCH|nr:hypothetical protein EGW08_005454 [Elysia chlorotica]
MAEQRNAGVAYLGEYRTHNMYTTDVLAANCSAGSQWAWLAFGECLLRPSHILGYWLGIFSTPLWIIGSFWSFRYMHRVFGARVIRYVLLALTTDVLSLTGAVLSMETVLLIIFGFVSVVVDCFVLLAFVIAFLKRRRKTSKARYMEVNNAPPERKRELPGPVTKSPSRWCCVLGCTLVLTGLLMLIVLVSGQFGSDASSAEVDVPTASPQGHLDNKSWLYSEKCRDAHNDDNEDDDKDDDDDDVILESEDNKLLKSSESDGSRAGSLLPARLTMPGMRRSSVASHRLSDKTGPCTFWPMPVSRGRPRICSFETGSSTESESSMSQIHEIEFFSLFVKSQLELRLLHMSSHPDPSVPTADQLYRDRRCSIPRIVVQHSGSQSPPSRPSRLALSGLRMSTVNDTSPESTNQRVRSWVSQHTPEQEAVPLPSLTLTLNLDTSRSLNSPTAPDAEIEEGISMLMSGRHETCSNSPSPGSLGGARFGHHLGAHVMVPRKNSL